MEKIKILADEPASIILFNALCAVGHDAVARAANKAKQGANVKDQTLDCELTIGGEVVPITPFFDRIWKEVQDEAERIAKQRLKDLIEGNSILSVLQDLNEKVESTFRSVDWEIHSKLREMGVQIDD